MNVGEAVHFLDRSAVVAQAIDGQQRHVFDYKLVDSNGQEVELEVNHDSQQVIVRS